MSVVLSSECDWLDLFLDTGYKEFVPYLEALDRYREAEKSGNFEEHEQSLHEEELNRIRDTCTGSLQTVTRRYARKQHSWYKNKWAAVGSPLFSTSGHSCLFCMDVSEAVSDDRKRQELINDAVAIVNESLVECNDEIDHRLVEKYLVRQPLPSANTSASDEVKMQWKKYYCDKCERELNGWNEWEAHLKSRMHKKRRRKKRAFSDSTSSSKEKDPDVVMK